MSNFSEYHFQTGIICLLFYLHMYLELSNFIVIVLVSYFEKIVKPRDHNEIKPLTG